MPSARTPVIELRQLSYFVAIADAGTISSAAGRLGISQPSLSDALSRIEALLGATLVIRSARGTQLTDAGHVLARYGRDILRSVETALAEVRLLGGEARGSVAVGLPPSVALLLSVPLAETVGNELPNVKLRLAESMSGYVLDWLKSDHIDLGVVYQGQDCSHLDARPLLIEELFLVAAPDYMPGIEHRDGMACRPVEFCRLPEFPLILPSRSHGLRELLERFAKSQNVILDVVLEMDALRHIVTMVSRASACTILSHAAVMDEVLRGELILIPIAEPAISRTAYTVRRRGRPVSHASLAVETAIGSILQELIDRARLKATLPVGGGLVAGPA